VRKLRPLVLSLVVASLALLAVAEPAFAVDPWRAASSCSASSTYSTFDCTRVNDGNDATAWTSTNPVGTNWVQLNYSSVYTFTSWRIKQGTIAADSSSSFVLESSTNGGSSWSTIATGGGTATTTTGTIPGTSRAQTWRVRSVTGGGNGWQVHALELFGEPYTAPTPAPTNPVASAVPTFQPSPTPTPETYGPPSPWADPPCYGGQLVSSVYWLATGVPKTACVWYSDATHNGGAFGTIGSMERQWGGLVYSPADTHERRALPRDLDTSGNFARMWTGVLEVPAGTYSVALEPGWSCEPNSDCPSTFPDPQSYRVDWFGPFGDPIGSSQRICSTTAFVGGTSHAYGTTCGPIAVPSGAWSVQLSLSVGGSGGFYTDWQHYRALSNVTVSWVTAATDDALVETGTCATGWAADGTCAVSGPPRSEGNCGPISGDCGKPLVTVDVFGECTDTGAAWWDAVGWLSLISCQVGTLPHKFTATVQNATNTVIDLVYPGPGLRYAATDFQTQVGARAPFSWLGALVATIDAGLNGASAGDTVPTTMTVFGAAVPLVSTGTVGALASPVRDLLAKLLYLGFAYLVLSRVLTFFGYPDGRQLELGL